MPSTELPELLWGNREEPLLLGAPTLRRTNPLSRDAALRGLVSGWSYFAPVPRIAIGNKMQHCATSFDALVVDIDREPGIDPDELVAEASGLLPASLWPTAIVYSGNRGLHLYWKLDSDLPISRIEDLNRALASRLGGDNCHDRTHLFRNPGTRNPKSGRLAEILEMSGEIHPVSRFPSLSQSRRVRIARLDIARLEAHPSPRIISPTGWSRPTS